MLVAIFNAGGLLWLIAVTCLVLLTVTIHALGFAAMLRLILRSNVLDVSGFWRVTASFIGITCGLIVVHLLEISVWGLFYFWLERLPDVETAMYFSGVTYTSTGYGDIVLPKPWRLLAPLEALLGVLMVGLSTGLFFAIVLRWISRFIQEHRVSEAPSSESIKTKATAFSSEMKQ